MLLINHIYSSKFDNYSNTPVIHIISTQDINTILILLYVLIYTPVPKQIYNLKAVIYVLTPESASQRLTRKLYKNHFLFRKECGRPYDLWRETDKVGQTNCACIVHPRTTIFGN